MIQARIRKSFPASRESAAFSLDVDIKTSAGITVLFGSSGAGKTVTLDCIAGFATPGDGRILLEDEILFDARTGVNLPPQARQCGYVFQNYALFPHMSLRQNLAFAAERRARLERHRRVSEMLERFHLTEVAGRRPHEVSGGQKQRCSIARALIGEPKLLLLDEPARGLDAPLRAELYDLLRQVRAEFGTPILLVTHDLDECFELADEMLIMDRGRVVQGGPPRSIADRPANLDVARLLGIFNLLQAEIVELDPQRKLTRLRLWGAELAGPYFPGHLKGDRVWLCIRPEQLTVRSNEIGPGQNELETKLLRAVEMPQAVRLEFENGLRVEIPHAQFVLRKSQNPDSAWRVHFPQEALRVL